MEKWKVFWATVWKVILRIGKEIWSLVSDHDWNFDPWKLGGFGAFVFAGFLAIKVLEKVGKVDSTTLGILAGMVGAFITVGTFLFGQSRKMDQVISDNKVSASPAPKVGY